MAGDSFKDGGDFGAECLEVGYFLEPFDNGLFLQCPGQCGEDCVVGFFAIRGEDEEEDADFFVVVVGGVVEPIRAASDGEDIFLFEWNTDVGQGDGIVEMGGDGAFAL